MEADAAHASQVPRSPDQLISAAIELYRRYPILFLVLAAGVIVPYDLIALILTGSGPLSRAGASPGAQIALGLCDWVLIGPLISALHVHAVADTQRGVAPELRPVARRGVDALPSVVAATIMSGLGIALGFVALIVPGVILALRWFVVAQAAAIEREGWQPALRRSRQLTNDNYLHIFIFALYLGVITGIPSIIGSFGLGHDTTAVAFPIGLAIHLFTASFGALTLALLYFDLRAREVSTTQPQQVES